MSKGSAGESFDIGSLTVEQLGQLKEQFEQELMQFNRSLNALGEAASRFHRSGEAVEDLSKETEGKPLLLPVTDSMYIEGTLADTKNVLVEIGTGYYVEKSTEQAVEYCKRRVTGLKDSMDSLVGVVNDKRQGLMVITNVLNRKMAMAQQQAAQQQAAPALKA